MAIRSNPPTSSSSGTQVASDKIAMRAYEKWCERGCPHGSDQQDWYDAETELQAEGKNTSSPPGKNKR